MNIEYHGPARIAAERVCRNVAPREVGICVFLQFCNRRVGFLTCWSVCVLHYLSYRCVDRWILIGVLVEGALDALIGVLTDLLIRRVVIVDRRVVSIFDEGVDWFAH